MCSTSAPKAGRQACLKKESRTPSQKREAACALKGPLRGEPSEFHLLLNQPLGIALHSWHHGLKVYMSWPGRGEDLRWVSPILRTKLATEYES